MHPLHGSRRRAEGLVLMNLRMMVRPGPASRPCLPRKQTSVGQRGVCLMPESIICGRVSYIRTETATGDGWCRPHPLGSSVLAKYDRITDDHPLFRAKLRRDVAH